MYNKKVNNDARAYRAKTQKIYLANRQVDDNSAIFQVLGSSGKIYNVSLEGTPKCSCPDHTIRESRCKHILFMLLKIFNVQDPYQEEFAPEEIQTYIDNYKLNITRFNVTVDPNRLYIDDVEYDVGEKCTDDDCVICLDPILNGENYVHCKKSCGRCLHDECYKMIYKINKKCPYCSDKLIV